MLLIVDDDSDIASLIRTSLDKVGLIACSFTDPIMALEEFKSHYYNSDLLLSDIKMPTMNGYELVQQVKKIKPNIKVLIMSAFVIDVNLAKNFLQSGVDAFIEKPFSLIKLQKQVLSILNNDK
jgi:DNA-binding NtrC family response regulator